MLLFVLVPFHRLDNFVNDIEIISIKFDDVFQKTLSKELVNIL